jgi:hypothetical protein
VRNLTFRRMAWPPCASTKYCRMVTICVNQQASPFPLTCNPRRPYTATRPRRLTMHDLCHRSIFLFAYKLFILNRLLVQSRCRGGPKSDLHPETECRFGLRYHDPGNIFICLLGLSVFFCFRLKLTPSWLLPLLHACCGSPVGCSSNSASSSPLLHSRSGPILPVESPRPRSAVAIADVRNPRLRPVAEKCANYRNTPPGGGQ